MAFMVTIASAQVTRPHPSVFRAAAFVDWATGAVPAGHLADKRIGISRVGADKDFKHVRPTVHRGAKSFHGRHSNIPVRVLPQQPYGDRDNLAFGRAAGSLFAAVASERVERSCSNMGIGVV